MKKIRVRIAPSPTGRLHLGTAHTALFNYAFTRHENGDFILRIDDSDNQRSRKEFEADIINSLKWLRITWDEGPDIGGPFAPYRQSERQSIYSKYLEDLIKEKKAYLCYCTPEELVQERKESEAKKILAKYSGRCRNLSLRESKKLVSIGRKPSIRLQNPGKIVTFNDLIRGPISVNTALIGDFIIARSDKSALLSFAATVDDIEMQITHAIRGEDFINMVPKQLLIFEALSALPPHFAHLSFLYAPDRTKLSKRHGATSVSEYKEAGYFSETLINYLGSLGYSFPSAREFFTLEQFIADFDFLRIAKSAPIFDQNKLDWYNGHYIRQMDIKLLAQHIFEYIQDKINTDQEFILKTVPLIKERLKKLSDYLPLCEFLFQKPSTYEVALKDKRSLLFKIASKLKMVTKWDAKSLGENMQAVAVEAKIKNSDFFMILRVAITGKKISPPLNESMEILGKDEVLERLKNAIR